MEAVVHLERSATMPSQSQMAYSRPSSLHGRQNQPPADLCYKPNSSAPNNPGGPPNTGPGIIASSSGSNTRHSPAVYSTGSSSYNPMRYIHAAPYPPNTGGTPMPFRENLYSSRSSNLVGERGQQMMDYGMRGDNMPSQSKPRISLLTSPEYMSSISNRRHHPEDSYRGQIVPPGHQPMEVGASSKKIRLGDGKSDLQRTLRIDTRVHSKQEDGQQATAYTPQVEAISPTLPTETLQDETFKSTKDELLHGISKVDREITKTELQISTLKRKQQELEEAAKRPEVEAEEEEVPQPKHHSPAQKIYAENRRKAQEAHGLLKHLGPAIQLPLYNQPSDTAVYHENKMKHQLFKDRLMLHLRKKHMEREVREKRLTATYSVLVQEWLRKVDKVENSQKRKAREGKNREFFEKVFPRLRKQREDRERFNRVGARVKSEADLEEIMDGLQEQEMEDKKMRSYAVVPPLLLDAKQRSIFYINNNGRIDDFPAEYKERHLLNVWTQSEKDLFKEKFLQHPKNFGVIASYLEKKSVSDCVQYYYLSKKTENYKRLLRKSRVRSRSGRNPQAKVAAGSVPASNADLLSTATGVTTRFQREQLQKQEPLPSTSAVEIRPPLIDEGESQQQSNQQTFMTESPPLQPPLLLQHSEKPEGKTEDETIEVKKKTPDPETSDDDQYERPCDDVTEHQRSHLAECIVCKTASSISRALPKSQASQYGMKEEEVPSDARVCNLCRCKALRSRFTNCPVSSCPNAKMQRVKRLRSLPIKWVDLILSVRDQLKAEFGMDETLTKCCSLCYNRIVRKISASMDVSSFMTSKGKMNQARCSILNWSEEEIQKLKDGLRLHGINWTQIAEVVGGVKTPQQCMTFFYKYMKKLNLENHLPPGVKDAVLEERKPALTDEEESGSSTSSCDEIESGRVDGGADSDTASAPSPLQNSGSLEEENKDISITPPPQLIEEGRITITNPDTPERIGTASSPHGKGSASSSLLPPVLLPNKEDYDSSATETADEGQGGGETESGINQAPTPKRDEEPSSPLTVKDLMLNVIEMQLMKNPQGNNSANPGGPPTISSILKSDSSISYSQRERTTSRANTDNSSLATVSVVNTQHSHQPPVQDLRKEGLVVVQVPQNVREQREPEGVTLDLSIKRPRDAQPQINKPVSHHSSPQPSSHSVYRVSHQSQQQPMSQLQQQQQQVHQGLSQPQSHQTQQGGDSSGFFHQQILPPPLAPKLSPGVITGAPPNKPQCGSIIHGTPVSSPSIYNQGRYDQQSSTPIILHTSPHKEPGSITQGTPVHQRSSLFPSNSEALFNKRMAPQGFYPPRLPAFNVEQRQIIMNDFITSREMHAPSSSNSRNGRDKMYYPSSARQGVIQRHNTKPPSPGVSHHPPGYEAFSSLVDVASRQPSLPVPSPMAMSMPDVKNMSEDKRHLHGEGLGERFNRDSPHDRFPSRESEMRYMKESSKVHNQPPDRRDHQQQSTSMLQLREQMPPHSRENYSSHHNMEREMQAHQMNIREQQHRERDHHNHQTQKMREHQIHVQQQQQQQQRDLELRGVPRAIQNYPQRIIHNDPHMNMDQRLIQVQIYREQPSSSQSSTPSSSSHTVSRSLKQEQSTESQNMRNRTSEGSTLTAASLIDAIITHQINQSSEGQSSHPSGTGGGQQPQHTRPGDRLFQSFHRECSESNGKVSPMKSNIAVENKSQHPSSQQQVLGNDHMEVYGNQSQGLRSSMYQAYEPQTWKLRRALQPKEVEQPMHEKAEEHVNRGYYADPPVPLSPLDYVKNRIAEVMRTSEEDGAVSKGNDSPISPDVNEDMESTPVVSSSPYISQNPHAYTYPYSALSLTTGSSAGVSIAPQTVNKPGNEPIPEPAPLLSAQYEPLSDED